MDSKLTRVTVTIYGEEYTIRGTEKADHIKRAAAMVDEKMVEISTKQALGVVPQSRRSARRSEPGGRAHKG